MNYDIYLVGVGGQGVLTVAELISEAAFIEGVPVNYYPTEGMAQRGGFVKAQIRLGRPVIGPNIPEKGADLVIAVEVSEATKAVRYIKPGGDFILWGHVWLPTAAMLGRADYPGLDRVRAQIALAEAKLHYLDPETLPFYQGAVVPDNIYVLGATLGLTRLKQVLDAGPLKKAIGARWPKAAERNLYAFQAGLEASVDAEE